MATARELNEISQLENLGRYVKLTQNNSSRLSIPSLQGQRDPSTGKTFTISPGGGTSQVMNLSNAGGIAYGEKLSVVVNAGGTFYAESKNK